MRSVWFSRYFIRAGMPPTLCRSSITYFPEGLDRKFSAGLLTISGSDLLQVCQEGCLVSDSLEIVDREFDFSGPGHRKKVQNLYAHQHQRRGVVGEAHTALVEPPITLMMAMVLRKDWRVTISLWYRCRLRRAIDQHKPNQTHFGLRSSSIRFFKYLGALKHS